MHYAHLRDDPHVYQNPLADDGVNMEDLLRCEMRWIRCSCSLFRQSAEANSQRKSYKVVTVRTTSWRFVPSLTWFYPTLFLIFVSYHEAPLAHTLKLLYYSISIHASVARSVRYSTWNLDNSQGFQKQAGWPAVWLATAVLRDHLLFDVWQRQTDTGSSS